MKNQYNWLDFVSLYLGAWAFLTPWLIGHPVVRPRYCELYCFWFHNQLYRHHRPGGISTMAGVCKYCGWRLAAGFAVGAEICKRWLAEVECPIDRSSGHHLFSVSFECETIKASVGK